MKAKETVQSLLSIADIKIDGNRPSDIKVNNEHFYRRLLSQRELGFGESYMAGWWDAKKVDEVIFKIMSNNLKGKVGIDIPLIKSVILAKMFNKQDYSRAKKNAAFHYNIGNDLYERMLDKRMVYSCGYWKNAKTLDEAQEAKLDLICRKLYLKKGMTLLDIGCGWGGFAEYAAKKYGVVVTGISPAAEQVKLAKKRVKNLNVKILQKDYRDIEGQFDRIVSIGMLEHVGPKNYKTFFSVCSKSLKLDGMMLHHTIGSNTSNTATDPWVDKYIFPGGLVPSLKQLAAATEGKFIIEDLHNFGPDYDKTIMAWYSNFVKSYPEIMANYDQTFFRMWEYYLLSFAALFRARELQLWQIVFRNITPSKKYLSIR